MAIQLDSTKGITNVTWTNTTRPTTPVPGQQGFNTDNQTLETYTASGWASASGASFDPSSPGPIGNATPSTAVFTTASATGTVKGATLSATGTIVGGTNGINNSVWTSNTRPGTAVTGTSGYNSDIGKLEAYNGSSWVAAGGAGVCGTNCWTGVNTFGKTTVFANSITANGSVGTTSQVLMSGGANNPPQWVCGSSLVSAASPNVQSFTSSTTFTVTTPGTYTIHVIGGGGAGGFRKSCCQPRAATGGGAGGYARKTAFLAAGCYNITIGAGGAGTSSSGPGAAGGTSSFSGPGITTITANGGPGGNAGTSSVSGVAAGGTATGGDINVTGGGSGNVTAASFSGSGGGAVGILGVGYSSLDSTNANRSAGAGIAGRCGTAGNNGLGYAFPFGFLVGPGFGSAVGPGAGGPGGSSGGGYYGGMFAGGSGTTCGNGAGGQGGGGGGGFSTNAGGAVGTPGGVGMIIITH